MSATVTMRGVDYVLPTTGEHDWARSVLDFLAAAATDLDTLLSSGPAPMVWLISIPTGGVFYMPPGGYPAFVGPEIEIRIPASGTLRGLHTKHRAVVDVPSYIVQVYRNGVQEGPAVTVVTSGGSTGSDTSTELVVTAGDRIAVVLSNFSDGSIDDLSATLQFIPSPE